MGHTTIIYSHNLIAGHSLKEIAAYHDLSVLLHFKQVAELNCTLASAQAVHSQFPHPVLMDPFQFRRFNGSMIFEL